ncbi:hypothetical protein Bca101_009972 [Brassica carinata]
MPKLRREVRRCRVTVVVALKQPANKKQRKGNDNMDASGVTEAVHRGEAEAKDEICGE